MTCLQLELSVRLDCLSYRSRHTWRRNQKTEYEDKIEIFFRILNKIKLLIFI